MRIKLTKHNPVLEDTESISKTFKWWSTDSKKSYNIMSSNSQAWEYENSEDLVYNFNEWGYRTKNIDDLDKDFVLVFGCSYTEGVGLYQKDIWCEKLCKELGIDVLNLAKQGSAPDICYMNTILYVKNLIKYKPRLVIYQWPQSYRRTFAYTSDFLDPLQYAYIGDKEELHFANFNINTDASNVDWRWYSQRWLKECGEMNRDNYFNLFSVDVLWKALNIPVYHWSWSDDFEGLFMEKEKVRIIMNKSNDRARDCLHDGKQIHSDVKDFLIDDIRKLL
jgi:hypothetical protein